MNEKANQNFTELEVCQRARIFKNEIKDLTTSFPPDERFRLMDQIIRSSRGITATIAEGHGSTRLKIKLIFVLCREVP